MKRFIAVIFCLVIGFGTANADTIKMGFFELAPHALQVESSPLKGKVLPLGYQNGIAVELFNQTATKMGHDVEWYGALPFPRMINMLQNGELDGAIVLSKNAKREKFLHYTDKSMFDAHPVMVVLKDSPVNAINTIDDISGWKVGFLKGGHQSPFIKNNVSKLKMDTIGGNSWVTQCLKKMIAGRLDGVYDLNQYTIPFYAKQIGAGDKIKVLDIPDKSSPLYVAFAKASPKGAAYTEQFNASFTGFDYGAGVDKVK